MELNETFQRFALLLDERLQHEVHTTEDCIRYTFFHAALQERIAHTDIALEYPHPDPAIVGAKIDTLITREGGVAIEFKYDRANPGGTNQNRTQRAAAVLNDIFRLCRVPPEVASTKYFVYVTDPEMATYFNNPANRLCNFYGVCGPARFRLDQSLLEGASKTLATGITRLLTNCEVAGVLSCEVARQHSIRVFQVFAV